MRDVDPDILSLPQYLRQQGYETTGIGKTFDGRCVDGQLDAPSWSIPYGSGFRHEKERISPATGVKKSGGCRLPQSRPLGEPKPRSGDEERQ